MTATADPVERPGIWLTAQMSWEIVREAVDDMPNLFIGGAVGYFAISVLIMAGRELIGLIAPSPVDSMTGDLLDLFGSLVVNLALAQIWAAVAVPVHRLVLMNEKSTRGIFPLAPNVWTFALWIVALGVLFTVGPLVAAPVALLGLPLGAVLIVAVILAIFYASLRLSLVFPLIATRGDESRLGDLISRGWSLSKGRVWRIFLTSLAVSLPFILIYFVAVLLVDIIFGFSISREFETSGLGGWASPIGWIFRVAISITTVFAVAVQAAVLSWIYRFATADGAVTAGA